MTFPEPNSAKPQELEPFFINATTQEQMNSVNTRKLNILSLNQIIDRIVLSDESNTLYSSSFELIRWMPDVSFARFHALTVRLKYPSVTIYKAPSAIIQFSTLSCKTDTEVRGLLYELYIGAMMNFLADKKINHGTQVLDIFKNCTNCNFANQKSLFADQTGDQN